MESILSIPSVIWKSSSQGGPQHEFGGMIGVIVQCCTSALKSGHYVVSQDLWSIVKSQFTQSLCIGIVLQLKEKRRMEQALPRRQLGVVWNQFWDFFLSSPPYKGHCLGTHCVLLSQGIVLRSPFRVIFPRLALVLLYQKAEVKTSPLSGIWLPSVSHFYNVPASPVRMFLF